MGTASERRVEEVPNSAAQRARIADVTGRGPVGVLRHCLTVGIQIRGTADEEDLREELRGRLARAVARRPALRAVFGGDAGGDGHLIRASAEPVVRRHRVAGATPEARWATAHMIADFEANRPFGLGETPLVRGTLLTAEKDRHLFVLAFDQLSCDAWSANLVVDDLLADDGAARGSDGYETVWRDREAWLAADEGRAAVCRRREAAAGASRRWAVALEGHGEDPEEVVELFLGVDDDVTTALRERLRAARGSLLAAGATALAAGVADDPEATLALRSTLAGRESTAEQGVVGWFANSAVLALPSRRGTVLEYATALRGMIFEALTAQRVPYELVDDVLAPGTAGGPSCAVVFLPRGLSGGDRTEYPLGGALASRTAVSVCPTGADIDFFLIEEGPPIGDTPPALLTVGARSRRAVASPQEVEMLLERWVRALYVLAGRDWRTTPVSSVGTVGPVGPDPVTGASNATWPAVVPGVAVRRPVIRS